MGYKINVSQLISIVEFQNLVWVLMFSKLAYAMIKNGKQSYVSQLISIADFRNLVWVLIFSKLPYAMIKNGKKSYVSQLIPVIDFWKWEIKLCISVNIYCRLPKLGMSTHVFKISLCYDKKL